MPPKNKAILEKPCPEGKVRNPSTGRCINKQNQKLASIPKPASQPKPKQKASPVPLMDLVKKITYSLRTAFAFPGIRVSFVFTNGLEILIYIKVKEDKIVIKKVKDGKWKPNTEYAVDSFPEETVIKALVSKPLASINLTEPNKGAYITLYEVASELTESPEAAKAKKSKKKSRGVVTDTESESEHQGRVKKVKKINKEFTLKPIDDNDL